MAIQRAMLILIAVEMLLAIVMGCGTLMPHHANGNGTAVPVGA